MVKLLLLSQLLSTKDSIYFSSSELFFIKNRGSSGGGAVGVHGECGGVRGGVLWVCASGEEGEVASGWGR